MILLLSPFLLPHYPTSDLGIILSSHAIRRLIYRDYPLLPCYPTSDFVIIPCSHATQRLILGLPRKLPNPKNEKKNTLT